MSGFSASTMSTPYLPTNQRISRVVIDPPLAPATRPAKVVRRCLGSRYCGRTFRRSDTVQPRIEYRSLYRAGASGEWFLPMGTLVACTPGRADAARQAGHEVLGSRGGRLRSNGGVPAEPAPRRHDRD